MSLLRRLIGRLPVRTGSFFGTAFVTYAGMGLSLLSAPLLARSLGADGRGALAGAFISIQLLSWIAFVGLPRGLALQEHKRQASSRAGVLLVACLGPISGTLAFVSAGVISNGDDRITLGMQVGSSVLVFAGLAQVGTELVLVQGKIWRFNLIRVVNVLVPSLAYIVVFLAGHLTLVVAFIITLSCQLLATLLGCLFAIRALRSSTRVPPPWSFSLRIWISSAFDSVGGRVDQLLLTALVGASTVGVYAVAVTCAVASGGLTQALNHLTYSKLAARNEADAAGGLRRRSRLGVGISLVVGTGVIAAVALVGDALFGPGFEDLLPVTAILVASQLLNDQWQLRVYAQSAGENATSLALASGISLGFLGLVATALALTGTLSGVTMGFAVFGFSAARLLVRALLLLRT